jgi:uncharacterized membrane protein
MENNFAGAAQSQIKTKDITISGLLIAVVFIATRFIYFPSPIASNGGIIHFGNVALFTAAIIFGKKKGAIAGAFGMALFDILSPFAVWAPFTFVVRGIMGYIIGSIANARGKKGESITWNIIGIILGGLWMLVGYYISEAIIYNNVIAPVKSIPGNITQIVIGAVLSMPIILAMPVASKIKKLKQ